MKDQLPEAIWRAPERAQNSQSVPILTDGATADTAATTSRSSDEPPRPTATGDPSSPPPRTAAADPPAAPEDPRPARPTRELNAPNSAPPLRRLEDAKPLAPSSFPNPPRANSHLVPTTIPNLVYLLRSYEVTVRYDVIKKKILIGLPGYKGSPDNFDNVSLTHIISLASLNGLQINPIPSYVEAIGDQNIFNPVAEWINSKRWDGVDRLPLIYKTLIEREGYPAILKHILMYRWLLSLVAAALKASGFKARGVLTLQGPQGIGKTSWLLSLVPDIGLREAVVKVDHHLDGANKDSILGAICHWIVEIGELDSSFRKDVARLKGFLTSDSDKVRRPYARAESEYPRRTVFYATVNESNFLVDLTGNTRWWTIPVKAIDYAHGIDMQQLFAQLAVDFHAGVQWWLTTPEEALLESCNQEHQTLSVIRERLMEKVDTENIGPHEGAAMTALEVLKMLDFENPTNGMCKECAAILRDLFGEPKRIKGQNRWRIPVRAETSTLNYPIY